MKWPSLPSVGFIRGRAATVVDIDNGEAVFCQQANGDEVAKPWPIDIPQYALWRDETGTDLPSVVVQAEAHILKPDDEPVIGLRLVDGTEVVATGSEVKLLGTDLPS